jgi:L-histidine N-alpha-methyltransferase
VEDTGMVEGHLYALCDQQVRLPRLDVEIAVRCGESINVGFSAKFDGDRLDSELAEHGMTVQHRWLDPEWQYGILLARRND